MWLWCFHAAVQNMHSSLWRTAKILYCMINSTGHEYWIQILHCTENTLCTSKMLLLAFPMTLWVTKFHYLESTNWSKPKHSNVNYKSCSLCFQSQVTYTAMCWGGHLIDEVASSSCTAGKLGPGEGICCRGHVLYINVYNSHCCDIVEIVDPIAFWQNSGMLVFQNG